jgi:Holliday junction resolvase RusA-like endonuclease
VRGITVESLIQVNIKPLSVNTAWQGKRFKTDLYRQYEKAVLLLLPPFDIPPAYLKLVYEFGFSNPQSDLDNPVKPFTDILQKKYGFNDSRVHEIVLRKKLVTKGMEYIKFSILPYCQEVTTLN